MSWDSYLDNLVAQTKDAAGSPHADKAVLIGLDGSKWTTDGHGCALKISTKEASKIASSFKSNKFSDFMTSGVVVAGVKYQFLREMDEKIVLCKMKGQGAITLQKTKTAIVIGHCKEGGQQGLVNKGVGIIADYLESLGM